MEPKDYISKEEIVKILGKSYENRIIYQYNRYLIIIPKKISNRMNDTSYYQIKSDIFPTKNMDKLKNRILNIREITKGLYISIIIFNKSHSIIEYGDNIRRIEIY